MIIRIGVECEQLEDKRFGIGQTLAQLLEAVSHIPHIEKKYRFVLYFKKCIPDDRFLHHPVFEKKVLMPEVGCFNASFNIFYHILLPWHYHTDHINIFLFPSNMLPAFFIGKAIVILVNDVYWEAHHGTIPWKHRISYLLFCWWAARRATIMTISQYSKKELQRYYHIPDARIVVNPWPLNPLFQILPRTPVYTAKIQEYKKRFGITHDFILSIGQAFPRRHIKESMEAFGQITSRYPHLQYVVMCLDKYQPPLLKHTADEINKREKRDAILFDLPPYATEELVYMMNEAKMLVYVSSQEAYGLPPIEAILCGTPALVAHTPTTQELFGTEGFFVHGTPSPQEIHDIIIDTSAIADGMENILRDPARASAITHTQAERFRSCTWQCYLENFFSLCDRILKR